jgi:NAD(P)H-dependent FMN reductase
MATKPLLQVIICSTRPGRVGLPVTQWFAALAGKHGAFEVEVIDLAEVNLPFMDEPKHPKLHDYAHEHTKRWSATINRADAYVFVMPEYNHGFNSVVKNAVDFLHDEWQHKAAAFVSYGGIGGGTRAVQMFKLVLVSLKVVPLVEAVHMPFVFQHISDGTLVPTEMMETTAEVMLTELAKQAIALRPLREPV